MGVTRFQVAVSLDGYIAGPRQSQSEPLGEGGERLHDWMTPLEAWRRQHEGYAGGTATPSTPVLEEVQANIGAVVMGRNMFGGGPGPWKDTSWRGWWGENPPFHTPVYVVTHHARPSAEMEGGTTFHFVTDGVDAAIQAARDTAGERDVLISGGANVIQQALALGAVDEFFLHITPLILGDGERLLVNVGDLRLRQIRGVVASNVTHLKYHVEPPERRAPS
ncbi:dihydrofolate reductase [Spiractinospora alimapuensis]|uniref:dihydrofolate reductase family protein n=1 Tax=Spiractinospora alimapuensis TaxID=2820884 RepID=UPI001F1FE359|nr:dihydrofolate reductase family protein [Spiractinospora alimapuensis]QVQ54227.1 dihydrofolate reductase [Spiractinospora alimapuensis]